MFICFFPDDDAAGMNKTVDYIPQEKKIRAGQKVKDCRWGFIKLHLLGRFKIQYSRYSYLLLDFPGIAVSFIDDDFMIG